MRGRTAGTSKGYDWGIVWADGWTSRRLINAIFGAISISYPNRPLSQGDHVESQEHGKPRTEFASGRGLPFENKAFNSPGTQQVNMAAELRG